MDALGDSRDIDVLAYDSTHFEGYAALADALGPSLERHDDVVLVAESFAGPLAVLLAYRHPGRVRALVMAASFVRGPLPFSGFGATLLQRLPAISPPVFALEHVLAGSGLPPPLRAEFEAILASMPLPVLRARAQAALRVDVTRELAALRVPVLYLQARHDRLIWPRAGRDVLRLARDARKAVIDAPHFLFQMAPAAAATEIDRFMDDLRGGASA
jgi:pimeloyl-ACP methyl ester carboxylesterase